MFLLQCLDDIRNCGLYVVNQQGRMLIDDLIAVSILYFGVVGINKCVITIITKFMDLFSLL